MDQKLLWTHVSTCPPCNCIPLVIIYPDKAVSLVKRVNNVKPLVRYIRKHISPILPPFAFSVGTIFYVQLNFVCVCVARGVNSYGKVNIEKNRYSFVH